MVTIQSSFAKKTKKHVNAMSKIHCMKTLYSFFQEEMTVQHEVQKVVCLVFLTPVLTFLDGSRRFCFEDFKSVCFIYAKFLSDGCMVFDNIN